MTKRLIEIKDTGSREDYIIGKHYGGDKVAYELAMLRQNLQGATQNVSSLNSQLKALEAKLAERQEIESK